MPSTASVLAACALAVLIPGGCKSSGATPVSRGSPDVSAQPKPGVRPTPTPRCATQDCKTGKIIDDGCVSDGKGGRLCASCVNACP